MKFCDNFGMNHTAVEIDEKIFDNNNDEDKESQEKHFQGMNK